MNQTVTLDAAGTATVTVSPASNTTYSLVDITAGGCTVPAMGDVTISISSLLNASIAGTANICQGQSTNILFSGTPNATISYFDGSMVQSIVLDAAGNASINGYSPTMTTNLSLIDVSLNGCTETAAGSITITIIPPPTVNMTDVISCNAPAFLDAGNPGASYTWYVDGVLDPTQTGQQYVVNAEPSPNALYTVEVDLGGCVGIGVANLAILAPEITTNPDPAEICDGACVDLTVTGADIQDCTWNPTTGLTPTTGCTVTACPTTTTTYTVTTTHLTAGGNLIINGDFEQGDTGFTSDHTSSTLPSNGMAQGAYGIGQLPPSLWAGQCTDHTTGTGNQMIFNAATTAGLTSWCQTVSVNPNTNYTFSYWGQTINSTNNANLIVNINGIQEGSNLLLGSPCDWQQFTTVWNSGASTSAVICILNQNIAASGNDFAIDDISLTTEITTMCMATETVTVLPAPMVSITASNSAICAGQPSDLIFTGTPGAVVAYFDGER